MRRERGGGVDEGEGEGEGGGEKRGEPWWPLNLG